jgi:periplasmic protein TonB
MAKFDIYSTNWTEIIFDNKNKIYGAYNLRKRYAKNMELACIAAIATICVLVSIPKILESLTGQKITLVNGLSDEIILTKIVEKIIPQIIPAKILPPPTPPPAKTEAFVSPEIVDQMTSDAPPSIFDLSNADIAIKTDTGFYDDSPIQFSVKSNGIVEVDNNIYIGGIEIMPLFPGGEEALFKFIKDNIVYPAIEKENNIYGKVHMTFVIDKDGNIIKIAPLKEIQGGKGLTKEATRVISSMPKWKPGKQNGQQVAVQFNLPINFALK